MKIDYTLVAGHLDWVLVGYTERGVCVVKLGGSERELEAELKAEFPHAKLERSDARSSAWVDEVVRRARGKEAAAEIPLDIEATAFQRRVWQALCEIPHGATCSYQQVAERTGNPRAYRAVANACASNPVAIVVPCHRVIRSDGTLGGYGGGIERKQELLRLERESAARAAGGRTAGSGKSGKARRVSAAPRRRVAR